uniref:Putative ovule protein n=1 Tax=Solanum chacoense TaxID=4108 RepID=A0A0V0GU01_SOLCH
MDRRGCVLIQIWGSSFGSNVGFRVKCQGRTPNYSSGSRSNSGVVISGSVRNRLSRLVSELETIFRIFYPLDKNKRYYLKNIFHSPTKHKKIS